ncbi:MAG: hypothetical protein QOH14_3958 [Pseudonocardiales bacterium]|jgi:hypothetical protein|nr:hypothetical protein [Pseudonocardiales bacterium]
MSAPPPVIALPWYARGYYSALLKLFSDPDKLPTTYDAWLERAEGVERQFKKGRFHSRQDLDPSCFLCRLV